MPWLETAPMKERFKFIGLALSEMYTMSELCARCGISRKTGQKWLARYESGGEGALADRSRKPHFSPNALDEDAAAAIFDLRKRHPTWGPRKLLEWLDQRRPELALPATSTIGAFLKRQGLVEARRRRRTWKHPGQPTLVPALPNELWAADFKGQFRTSRAHRAGQPSAERCARTNAPDPQARDHTTARARPAASRSDRYAGHVLLRLVSNAACFRFKTRQIFLSQALKQDWIGLEETDDGGWAIYFYDLLLANKLDERDLKLYA